MKKLGIIYQSVSTRKIINFEISDKNYFDFKIGFIDCDLDSIILESQYFENENLKTIKHAIELKDKLYPVITIDEKNNILMQAFLNQLALQKTFETGFGNYFSRSRNSLWFKGGTSNSTQVIKEIFFDDKNEFFVYVVKQNLAACHDGYYSCFYRKFENLILTQIDFKKII